MFLQVSVCPQGCIPACLAGHMTRQYISRCTVDVSQLVWMQHTGNIKCMIGYVTWAEPPTPSLWVSHPLGQTPPGSDMPPGSDTPKVRHPPWVRHAPLGQPPSRSDIPQIRHPQARHLLGQTVRHLPGQTPPPPPKDTEKLQFNCRNTFLTCFLKYFHRLMSLNVLLS